MANPFVIQQELADEREFEDELAGIERELADDVPDVEPDDPRGSRRQRRTARGNEREEDHNQRLADLQSKYDQLEGRYTELSNRLSNQPAGSPYSQPQQPQEDPRIAGLRSRVAELRQTEIAAGERLVQLERAKAGPQEMQEALNHFQNTQSQIQQINGAIGAAAALPHLMPAPKTPQDERYERDRALYPDVFHNPEALALYSAELIRRSKGRQGWMPSDEDTVQAVELARKELSLGRYSALPPTQHMVAATTGYPTGNSGGPGSGAQMREMTDMDWMIAKADLPNATAKEQEAHYRRYVMSQERG